MNSVVRMISRTDSRFTRSSKLCSRRIASYTPTRSGRVNRLELEIQAAFGVTESGQIRIPPSRR